MIFNQLSASALPEETLVNQRFRVKKVLGNGGYGNVYLVEDEIVFPGNKFALKESLSSTDSEKRQFVREAKWLTTLEHPNLPRVIEQFSWNGSPYFVMAYVEGENLEDRVDREGSLPEEQVLNWMLPIFDAVIYLHTRKRPIIHRDVKPGNIIVQDQRPWLVDFGIAKVLQPSVLRDSRKTTRAARAVSGGYSPLEQYTQGGTDVRSDVYALGATLYHLLTGICPPEAPDIVSGVARLPEARLVDPKITISSQTNDAIMRAMRQKPEERYQSVREMMLALPGGQNFTINPNGTASQPVVINMRGQRSRKAAKNTPVAALSAGTPAVAVVAPVAVPTPPALPTPVVAKSPPAKKGNAPLVPAARLVPAQQGKRPVPETQPFVPQPPMPEALPPKEQPKQATHRRVWLAGLVALLCGLLVLTTMTLTFRYPNSQPHPLWYVQGYRDIFSQQANWSLYGLFALILLAAAFLVALPFLNWVGILGRAWTWMFLLVLPLIGLASLAVWLDTTVHTNLITSMMQRGFFVPIALFALTWLTSIGAVYRQIFPRKGPRQALGSQQRL